MVSNSCRQPHCGARKVPCSTLAHTLGNGLSLCCAGNVDRLHCFEPSGYSADRLRAALAGRQGVTIEQVAVSDGEGHADLHVVSRGGQIQNSLTEFTDPMRSTVRESWSCVTIDGYCARNQVDRISLLKVDAEGHELRYSAEPKSTFVQSRLKWCSSSTTGAG